MSLGQTLRGFLRPAAFSSCLAVGILRILLWAVEPTNTVALLESNGFGTWRYPLPTTDLVLACCIGERLRRGGVVIR